MIKPFALAGGLLVLAACGRDASPDDGVGQGLFELTVIDAVQLGAAQGCHALAGTVEGSLTIKQLEDSDGLVLLLEDGYPLCIDTMESVAFEIDQIEATYREVGPPSGTLTTDEVVQMMGGTDEMQGSDPSGKRKTDPNPQPAGPQPATSGFVSPTGQIQTTPDDPSDPSDPSDPATPPDPPPESED